MHSVYPNDDCLNAMLYAPVPTDAYQLRSFLGLISWYSKFISSFATVVEPLRACIRKEVDFSWSEEVQKSFNTVKELLLKSSALALFDPNLPIVV